MCDVQRCLGFADLTLYPASHYPRTIDALGERFNQRNLPELVRWFLYLQDNPEDDRDVEEIPLVECPYLFNMTDVSVFHSAQATFFAPSNPSGARGMYRETIQSTPRWTRGEIPGPRRDCVFVSAPGDKTDTTVNDLNVAWALSFFSFSRSGKEYQCTLVHWFSTFGCEPDPDMGMWVVVPDYDRRGYRNVSVIHIDSIVRGAHLSPVFNTSKLPNSLNYTHSLDYFSAFYMNKYIDPHAFELLQ